MIEEQITIPAGRFKAQCLAILDRVAERGQAVVVTKRGKPVAKVVPAHATQPVSLLGSVRFHRDIVRPVLDEWDLDR